MTLEAMIRGLVRAAEFKEQGEDGMIWDDECRLALEEARRRGFGKSQAGATEPSAMSASLWQLLDDIDTLGDFIKPGYAPGEGRADDSWARYFRAVNQIAAKRHELLESDGYSLKPPTPVTWPATVQWPTEMLGLDGRVSVTFACAGCQNSSQQPLTVESVPALAKQMERYAAFHGPGMKSHVPRPETE